MLRACASKINYCLFKLLGLPVAFVINRENEVKQRKFHSNCFALECLVICSQDVYFECVSVSKGEKDSNVNIGLLVVAFDFLTCSTDGEAWRTIKFADVSQFPMSDSPDMRVWERRLLYCVPVPGQNPWTEPSSEVVMNSLKKSTYYTDLQREKRQREEDPIMDDMDMEVSAAKEAEVKETFGYGKQDSEGSNVNSDSCSSNTKDTNHSTKWRKAATASESNLISSTVPKLFSSRIVNLV
nr:mini-chromosome maintenance complex-binding protein [Ipomoea batatas]